MLRTRKKILLVFLLLALAGCKSQTLPTTSESGDSTHSGTRITEENAHKLLIVDCLLPGQVRKLGTSMTYLTARRPIKASAFDCEIRGGEYVAFDRADYRTALKVWLSSAKKGDAEAQVTVGEIFEKGLGVAPNYTLAAQWYQKATAQGNARGAINLGYLYEKGLGVKKDTIKALNLYRKASGLESDDLQFASTIEARSEQKLATLKKQNTKLEKRLQVIKTRLEKKQTKLNKLERQKLNSEAKQIKQNLDKSKGPSIELLDPPLILTRGIPTVPVRSHIKKLVLVGKVNAPSGIKKLIFNKRLAAVDTFNHFQIPVTLKSATTPVSIVAIDKLGRSARINFQLTHKVRAKKNALAMPVPVKPAKLDKPVGIDFGKYYALVIGNNAYQYYPPLQSAVNDAQSVAQVLKAKYGFETTVLINARRYQILEALSTLRNKLTANDNLLIYYAGHGELDATNERGHWIAVDAEPAKLDKRVSNTEITDIINTMTAKHVLVIADSCYSGSLTSTAMARRAPDLPDNLRLKWYKVMAASVSRTALTSGGLEPVVDSGGGDHSIFAHSLLSTLKRNDSIMEAYSIYRQVWHNVATEAAKLNIEQTPQYAPIRHTGHEAGEFLFVPKVLQGET